MKQVKDDNNAWYEVPDNQYEDALAQGYKEVTLKDKILQGVKDAGGVVANEANVAVSSTIPSMIEGATMGLSRKGAGALMGLGKSIMESKSPAETIPEEINKYQQEREASYAANPVSETLGGIAGGIMSGGVVGDALNAAKAIPGVVSKLPQIAGKVSKIPNALKEALKNIALNAAEGGAAGAGYGESPEDVLAGAGSGALLGANLQGVGAIAKAASPAINKAARYLRERNVPVELNPKKGFSTMREDQGAILDILDKYGNKNPTPKGIDEAYDLMSKDYIQTLANSSAKGDGAELATEFINKSRDVVPFEKLTSNEKRQTKKLLLKIKELGDNASAEDIGKLKIEIANTMGINKIFQKINRADQLTPTEEITKAAWETMDDFIKNNVPEAKDISIDMSKYHQVKEDINKAGAEGVAFPFIRTKGASVGFEVPVKRSVPIGAANMALKNYEKPYVGNEKFPAILRNLINQYKAKNK